MTQALSPLTRGWWTPADTAPAAGIPGIHTALMTLSRPAYIVDMNGTIGGAGGGMALLGDQPPPAASPNQAWYPVLASAPALLPDQLGDRGFKQRHGLSHAYVAGAMANGIASTAMVKTMAQNGMLGYFRGRRAFHCPRLNPPWT